MLYRIYSNLHGIAYTLDLEHLSAPLSRSMQHNSLMCAWSHVRDAAHTQPQLFLPLTLHVTCLFPAAAAAAAAATPTTVEPPSQAKSASGPQLPPQAKPVSDAELQVQVRLKPAGHKPCVASERERDGVCGCVSLISAAGQTCLHGWPRLPTHSRHQATDGHNLLHA
jgi:hypothetical protein